MLYPTELRARRDCTYHRPSWTASRRGAFLGVFGSLLVALCRSEAEADVPVRVRAIERADQWLLEDGHVLRLASIVVPDDPATVEPAARLLMADFLPSSVLAGGPAVSLDRHGRLLATARDDRGRDPRVVLLQAGLAVVRPGEEPTAQVQVLLADEAIGRAAGLGIWGQIDHAQVAVGDAGRRIGRFTMVEGTVVSVSERWEATFLDFGPDWRTDFTVRIRKQDRALFLEAGFDLPSLVGRKVRVRGWPFHTSGPMLELRDPLELQIVP